MKIRFARLASVLVHPAVVMPLAAVVATRHANSDLQWTSFTLAILAVAGIMIYSLIKAGSGSWSHIDASEEHERSQLNKFSSVGLLLLAGVLALAGSHLAVAVAIGFSGTLILLGHLLRHRLKPSLHVAFDAFATCIVWPSPGACVALLAATIVVAWSRLVLSKHSTSEVIVGGTLGVACGVAFQAVTIGLAA